MRKHLHLFLSIFCLMAITSATAQIKITEVMSSSGTGGTADWVELTNIGNSAVDITGWKIDDNSFAIATALTLNGVTSIPAGKSVIFIESAAPVTDVPAFKDFWGASLSNVEVGSYTGSGIGLSSSGDGAIIFDAAGNEINRVSFGAATTGKSFYWSYNSAGTVVDNGVISSAGTINGTVSNQVTLTSTNALGNIGSPGSAIVLPLNAGTLNPNMKPWRLEGKTLKFDVLPSQNVEAYSLTGVKIFTHESAREISLNFKQGIYILKVDGKATKITIR